LPLEEFRLRNDRHGYQDLGGAAFHMVGMWVGYSETVADLPVQQSTTVALTLNLETAKTLGRADEVIE
jgi:hypothetical protein